MKRLTKQTKIVGGDDQEYIDACFSPIGFEIHKSPDLTFYVYDMIGPPVDYVDFCHAIRYASEDQIITIHINSPGGSLNSCLSIINAIQASEAHIITVVDGEAASAAALIWLSGHERVISSNHTIVMTHGASVGFGGSKTSDIINSVSATNRIVEALLDELCVEFLTDEERLDIRRGMDVNLLGSDIMKRMELMKDDEIDED